MRAVGGEHELEPRVVEVPVESLGQRLGARLPAGRRLVIVAADVWAEYAGKRVHVAALQGTMVPVDGGAG